MGQGPANLGTRGSPYPPSRAVYLPFTGEPPPAADSVVSRNGLSAVGTALALPTPPLFPPSSPLPLILNTFLMIGPPAAKRVRAPGSLSEQP